jgi:Nickel responsive protein SCO4226-like
VRLRLPYPGGRRHQPRVQPTHGSPARAEPSEIANSRTSRFTVKFTDFHEDLELPQDFIDPIAQGTRDGSTDEFGVRQIGIYHTAEGKVYCLLEGPDEEAIRKDHEAVHVPCGDMHRVNSLL